MILRKRYRPSLSVTMRRAHIGGAKLFVDYAGDTVPVIAVSMLTSLRY